MSTPGAAPSQQQQRPNSERDLVFCHECQEEWYRDEHGLTCFACGSDFCEIIEQNHDPREEILEGDEEHELENPLAALLGAFMHPPLGPGNEHHPGQNPESSGRTPNAEETHTRTLSPGGTTFIRISGPGISIQQTFSSSFGSGVQLGGGSRSSSRGPQDPSEYTHPDGDQMRLDLLGIIRNIVGDHGLPAGQQQGPQQGGHRLGGDNPTLAEAGSGPPPAQGRTFTAFFPPPGGVRLGGEVADGPGPTSLPDFLEQIFGPAGDYVSSREELDRVISQLMEQHQGNAPPPAPRSAIDKLPRVKVTEEQAREGIDCAVCKDDLNIEEEVAKLPCKHIYHFECVSKWLEAHNTCPICRTPLEVPKGERPQQNQSQSQPQQQQQQQQPPPIPGSWNIFGAPTAPQQQPSQPQQPQQPRQSAADHEHQNQSHQQSQQSQDGHTHTHSWSWSGTIPLPHIPLPHIPLPNPLSHHDSNNNNNSQNNQQNNSQNHNSNSDGTNDNAFGPRATFANLFRRATGGSGGGGAGGNGSGGNN